jgi:hypothetical protein
MRPLHTCAQIVRSTHYCEATKAFTVMEYRDVTALGGGAPTSSVYPTRDAEGNLLTTEFGLCRWAHFWQGLAIAANLAIAWTRRPF